MRKKFEEHKILWLLLFAFLLKEIFYLFVIPVWQGPDEQGHFDYVEKILHERRIPNLKECYFSKKIYKSLAVLDFFEINQGGIVHESSKEALDAISSESMESAEEDNWIVQHPPFYYLLLSPFYLVSSPLGFFGQVYFLRFLSVLMGVGTLFLAYKIAQLLAPKNIFFSLGVPIFIAFLPQLSFMTTVIDNDNLVSFLSAILFFIMTKNFTTPVSLSRSLMVGILLGLGSLTKYTFLPMLAIVFIYEILRLFVVKPNLKDWLISGLVQVAIIFTICGWWYLRNYKLYGKIFAAYDSIRVGGHDVRGDLTLKEFLLDMGFFRVYFERFWSVHTWRILVPRKLTYIGAIILTITAFVGWLVLFLRRRVRGISQYKIVLLSFLLVALLIHFSFVAGKLFQVAQKRGWLGATHSRYMFTVLIPIAVYYVEGLSALVPKRLWRFAIIGLFVIAFAHDIWIYLFKVIPWFYTTGWFLIP